MNREQAIADARRCIESSHDFSCEYLLKIMEKLLCVVTEDEWLPIETAPKDEDVLVYADDTKEMFVAYFGVIPDGTKKKWIFAKSSEVCFAVKSPTRWRKCPASPESSQQVVKVSP